MRDSSGSVLDLTSSNPTQIENYPHGAVREALAGIADLVYRPDPLGLPAGREAIAHYYRQRGIAVDPNAIALTASTSEAYGFLFKLLCDPGDEVLIPAPSYPLFEYLAGLESVRAISYRLRYDGSWFLDFEDLRKRLTPRTRALVLVNPNNPTGSFIKSAELERLTGFCLNARISLISDEVFMDYEFGTHAGRVRSLIGPGPGLRFSLNGLSKTAGMPQLKLGWIVLSGGEDETAAARGRLELACDTYLSVNTPVQMAAGALLQIGKQVQRELLATARANLEWLTQAADGSPVHVLHTEGGWSVILQFPRTCREEEWLLGLFEQQQVLLQPGYFFDLESEAFLVASLITRRETFQEGITRTLEHVNRTTRR